MNGLSFLATDSQKEITLFFEDIKLGFSTTPEDLLMEIDNFILDNKALNQGFSDVAVVYSTSVYTLVPRNLFQESKASEYLKFNSKILANDYVAHDVLEDLGIVVVYVPFMNINNYFFDKYGSFNYYHSITVLLKSLVGNDKSGVAKMYLHFQQHSFDCIVVNNGKLLLCNTYNYRTPEDFIYFTLFSMEQLKLDPESLPVYLCGDISQDTTLYKMAYTYIRNIEFTSDFSPIIIEGEKEIHRNFILKNLVLCE